MFHLFARPRRLNLLKHTHTIIYLPRSCFIYLFDMFLSSGRRSRVYFFGGLFLWRAVLTFPYPFLSLFFPFSFLSLSFRTRLYNNKGFNINTIYIEPDFITNKCKSETLNAQTPSTRLFHLFAQVQVTVSFLLIGLFYVCPSFFRYKTC